jgi:dienelactone hydrolase
MTAGRALRIGAALAVLALAVLTGWKLLAGRAPAPPVPPAPVPADPPVARSGPVVSPAPGVEAGPYLPLVEPYGRIKDLRPGTPEGDLAARLDRAVRECAPGKKQRQLATLRVRLDYLASFGGSRYSLEDLAAGLEALLAGRDPLAAERGNSLRGYYAANDDSCQPYSLTLPENYDPAARYPLVLFLHHHGWSDWYRPFQGHPVQSLPGAIVAAPHGRGSCDYLWIAEDDALAVAAAVFADFPADPERVYVTGWSMGGTGSFHLPARYPDRFAASFPKAGNADFTAWEEAWKEDRRRLATPRDPERMFLRWLTAPVTYAENFLHVPIAIDHGAADSINPVGHSKSMAGRLKQLGYPNVGFRSDEAGGHGWGASVEERFEWMKQFRSPALPSRVRLSLLADHRAAGRPDEDGRGRREA